MFVLVALNYSLIAKQVVAFTFGEIVICCIKSAQLNLNT